MNFSASDTGILGKKRGKIRVLPTQVESMTGHFIKLAWRSTSQDKSNVNVLLFVDALIRASLDCVLKLFSTFIPLINVSTGLAFSDYV